MSYSVHLKANDGRRCGRCGAETHGTADAQPHLCADLRRRLQRQTNAVSAVRRVFSARHVLEGDDELADSVALDVVRALAGLDLGVE